MKLFGKCLKCGKCPYNSQIDGIEVDLVDARHVSACHKLEVNEMFFLDGKQVKVVEITDADGNKVKVLSV